MTRLLATIELNCEGFEANMSLDGRAQEFAKNSLIDLIQRGEIVCAHVNKLPEIEVPHSLPRDRCCA